MRRKRLSMKAGANQLAKMRREYQEKVREQMEKAELNPKAKIREIIQEARMFKQRRRERERMNNSKNFVMQNIEEAQDFENRQLEKTLRLKETNKELAEQTKANRDNIEQEKYIYNSLSLCKWEFIKFKRDEAYKATEEVLYQRKQVTQMLILAYSDFFLKEIWRKFQKRIALRSLHFLREKQAGRIQRALSKNFKSVGMDQNTRVNRGVKQAMTLFALSQIDNRKQQSKASMIQFFEIMKSKKQMDLTVQTYIPKVGNCISRIQRNVKMFDFKRKQLAKYFMREVEIMCAHYKLQKGAKKKEAKKNLDKISKILDKNN